ncbi:MAG TPA: hypothetical protein VFQ13_22735 [Anaerolineales bacterium]|nr:hypothetical protein [Anaerolineales bacterium]
MATRYFGERIKRNEDPRLLMGQGLYVDDVDLPNMLHAAFVRSPYAHTRIKAIDVSQARGKRARSLSVRCSHRHWRMRYMMSILRYWKSR